MSKRIPRGTLLTGLTIGAPDTDSIITEDDDTLVTEAGDAIVPED